MQVQMQGNENMMPMQGQMQGIQNQNIRQMNPIIRGNNPMAMQTVVQQQQQPGLPQNIGNPSQFSGPMGNFTQQRPTNPQQQSQQTAISNLGQQQRWMSPNQPNQARANQFMQQQQQQQNIMTPSMMQNAPQQQNSALISQLSQPPSLNPPNAMTPQQQNMIRMAMQQQQQNQSQMMGNSAQQNVPGMMQQQQNQQIPQQMQPQQVQVQQQATPQQQQLQRERIWRGILEWNDKQNQQNQMRQVPCEIYASISKETNEVEIRGDTWPQRLIMQLMPRTVISSVGGQLLRDAKVVIFQWGNSEAFESLSKVMANGFAGCVHFTNNPQTQCDVKILILLYMNDKKSYYGFVPNDQAGYVEKLRRVIQQSKITQFGQNQGGPQQQVQQQPQPNPQQIQQPPNVVGVGVRPNMMGMQQQQNQQGNPMGSAGGNQNVGNMMPNEQMMFNQQIQMQGNPQRPMRPNMMQNNNNLRHLLQQQQQQPQFRPQMGVPQQQQNPNAQQMQQHGMDQQYDMNFQLN